MRYAGWECVAIETAEIEALSIGKPGLELVGVADIEYSLAGHFGAHRDGRGVGVELEMGHGVSVRCKDHIAPLINGEAREVWIEVLAPGETVDLNRDPGIGAAREHLFPPRLEPRAIMKVSAARVGEDMHAGGLNGAQEPFGLIAVGVEGAVDSGHDASTPRRSPLGTSRVPSVRTSISRPWKR